MKNVKGVFARKMMSKNQPQAPAPAPVPTAPAIPAPKPWDATKFKIQLKMAKNRVDIQRGKKENEVDATRRVIAQHLSTNKETLARIQGERVLRERAQIEAFDVVDTFIELLATSNNVFTVQRDFDTAPADMRESVASVIYASGRLNIPELQTVTEMFRLHFGANIVDPLLKLEGPHISNINKILARKLEGGTPDGYLVLEELSKIATEHQLSWIPPPEDSDLDNGPGPSNPGYYRPVPLPYSSGGPGVPPPPPGGPGGYVQPMNIPGHNPYDAAPPFGGMPGDPHTTPSAPPSAPPPFDPAGNASGTLYPYADAGAPPQGGPNGLQPPPPPPASFLSDDALEAKFRNIKDNYGKQ